jgi:stage II sporulation protein D
MRRSKGTEGGVVPGGRMTVALVLLLAAGCATLGPGTPSPGSGGEVAAPSEATGSAAARSEPSGSGEGAGLLARRGPFLRIGLAVDRDSVAVSAPGGLRLLDLATGRETNTPADGLRIRRVAGGLEVPVGPEDPAGGPRQDILLEPRDPASAVRIDDHSYRGGAEVLALPGRGLAVINRVRLEDYLEGVVPLEIGPRGADEEEALKAQSVAARTYALANLGRRDSLGFDLFGDVEDQVYGGIEAESPRATRAVRFTRGEVLVWQGRPIRAYYHADGGGRTARVTEAWNLPDAPYLQSIPDTAADGSDWGAADPRHEWEASWSGSQLSASLAAGLAAYYGAEAPRMGRVTGVRVLGRTASGRVAAMEVRTAGGRYVIERNDIRFVLRRLDGSVLPSTLFRVTRAPGDGSDGLAVAGRGNGHGVGMCQWGAIGRARAGQTYRRILAAYYPGAKLRAAYGAPADGG